ncbi:MAG: c-type cytochrome [Marinicaulis sp.]|nr:c-type cytochrome [Marinicaulis sp.]
MQADDNKDPLLSNKIAAAALTVLLLIFGLPHIAGAILGGGHHGGEGDELHLAYCCVDLETTATGGDNGEKAFDLGTALANANVAGGERRAAICKSCHTFEEGGANGTGPNLYNIVNRTVGTVPGFNYSSALANDGGVWSYERLDAYLKNSQEYIPGTAMVQRFPKDDQRADLLAYLGSMSPNPAPYPEPVAPVIEAEVESAEEILEDTENAAEDTAAAIEEAVEDGADAVGDAVDGDDN